jgi:LmbE family N-acetylglucosaminyl deacetylase
MTRRDFAKAAAAAAAMGRRAFAAGDEVVIERPVAGRPHAGKVLAAIQAHSDDVPLSSAGTVAKLVHEGYTGYLIRTTNDDMGDAPGLGTRGTIGENVLRNERDNQQVARALGLKGVIDLNYNNHRMNSVSEVEVVARFVFLIRALKIDTVVCWDPSGPYEENPDHAVTARCVQAACWMAGREHDWPEHALAGLRPHAVKERYWYARHKELQAVNRVVDISDFVEQKVEANRANVAKGPAGRKGAELRAELERRGQRLALLGGDDATAERAYIRQFVLARNRELGRRHGVGYAEAFRYFGPGGSAVDEYVRKNASARAR